MAMRDFGVTFQPGMNGQVRTGSGPQPPRNPVQEAIQMLSLRLPKVFGASAIAPAPLLTSPGGMGQPAARGNMSAQALASLAGLPSGSGMPSMPAPIIPPLPPRPPGDTPRLPTFAPSPEPPLRGWDDWVRHERGLPRGDAPLGEPYNPNAPELPGTPGSPPPISDPAPSPSPVPALPAPHIRLDHPPRLRPPPPEMPLVEIPDLAPEPEPIDVQAIQQIADQLFRRRFQDDYTGNFTD